VLNLLGLRGKKKIHKRLRTKHAELKIGLWQRGHDPTIVFDYSKAVTEDVDIIKRIILRRFDRSRYAGNNETEGYIYGKRRPPLSIEMRKERDEDLERKSLSTESDVGKGLQSCNIQEENSFYCLPL
jgi:hypothetical protein